ASDDRVMLTDGPYRYRSSSAQRGRDRRVEAQCLTRLPDRREARLAQARAKVVDDVRVLQDIGGCEPDPHRRRQAGRGREEGGGALGMTPGGGDGSQAGERAHYATADVEIAPADECFGEDFVSTVGRPRAHRRLAQAEQRL